jgi:hypothetical protein
MIDFLCLTFICLFLFFLFLLTLTFSLKNFWIFWIFKKRCGFYYNFYKSGGFGAKNSLKGALLRGVVAVYGQIEPFFFENLE